MDTRRFQCLTIAYIEPGQRGGGADAPTYNRQP